MTKAKDGEGETKKLVLGEVIDNYEAFVDRAIKMATFADEEILMLCGTNYSLKFIEKIGLTAISKDKDKVGVKVRFLIPNADVSEEPKVSSQSSSMPAIVRTLDSSLYMALSFMIVNEKELLLWQSKEEDKNNDIQFSDNAALYSDTATIIESYHRIFESLWHHIDADENIINSRNKLAHMAEEMEFLFKSLAESNKDLLAANERLAVNDQMQREFINVAAHELRTPIQPLLIAANIIEDQFEIGKEKVEVTKEDIDLVIRNAKRLERLSSEILEVARIESGSFQLNKELLKLNETIQNVVHDISNRIQEQNKDNKDIRLECSMSNEVYIYADRERINEVLYNLLDNAIKFTRKGLISVNTRTENNEVKIQVSDTGTGIDPQIFEKLFTKFTTASEKGTGLGLYICKKVIEAHGGKIWAENNRNGIGATFTFSLSQG